MMDHRLAAAVRENAEWVDLVCRAHGLPTTFLPDRWHTARRSPPFYPDAETLRHGVPASVVLDGIEAGPGCTVKDSFADLDLVPQGFQVLFGATWICRPAGPPPGPVTWPVIRSPIVEDLTVTAFGGPEGSVIAHLSGDVVAYRTWKARGHRPWPPSPPRSRTESGATYHIAFTKNQYDALGRVTDSWDVRGNHSSTAFTPTTGGPVTKVVQTTPLGWTATTDYEPAWGAAVDAVDTNGRRTDASYDPLGRLTAVWHPGRSKSTQTPNVAYAYSISGASPNTFTDPDGTSFWGWVSKKAAKVNDFVERNQQQLKEAAAGIASMAIGAALMDIGSSAEVLGIICDSTGVGFLVGVPVAIAGAAAIGLGATMVVGGAAATAQAVHNMDFKGSSDGDGGGGSGPEKSPLRQKQTGDENIAKDLQQKADQIQKGWKQEYADRYGTVNVSRVYDR